MSGPAPTQPSPSLIGNLVAELRVHPPFAQMAVEHVQRFVAAARETYYAPGEVMLSPAQGPVRQLLYVRRGEVSGRQGMADLSAGGFQYEGGDLFPVGALMGERAVTATYEAVDDVFCLEVGAEAVHALAAASPPWADFLSRRIQQFLDLSRQALGATQAAHALAEHSLESPLATLPRKQPVACASGSALREALLAMHERRVGSVLVLDEEQRALGILTRHDVLERVALARPADDARIDEVMTRPVHTLDIQASAQDAALLMSRHGIRHLPLTEGGRVVSMVSERDLFGLQRRSLHQVSAAIRAARERPALVAAAAAIRQLAAHLVAQGLSARSLTRLISQLNDLLTRRLLEVVARERGVDLSRACWLSFGSEGRSEQTIATDQDNGLVFASEDPAAERPAWLAFAAEANALLDSCGYPLCKGNVMAGNPECCLTPAEWCERFDRWIDQGAPQDLLNASIYFDFRPLAGDETLAQPMRERVTARAAQVPRFIKQMAGNALRNRPALNWRGALDPVSEDGGQWIDLKLHGTTIFVDAARLYALAQGLAETGTVARLEGVAQALKVGRDELQGWINAFEYLQLFRLRVQIEGAAAEHPNRVDVARLDAIDRRILREAFRIGRRLQQRFELDYMR